MADILLTVSFGMCDGSVLYNDAVIPVLVVNQTLQKICEITDGQVFHAYDLDSLKQVYSTLQRQIGYDNCGRDAAQPGSCWVRSSWLARYWPACSATAGCLPDRSGQKSPVDQCRPPGSDDCCDDVEAQPPDTVRGIRSHPG
ncbi:hypothetical protein [Mycobacterium leprae]|uniref:L308_C1_175 n=1 Tax=Mycobacterium leprae TaxID=1769 RepID=Q49904_MYCLR|nr:hypothetical protein [Mycobacterium leprae]AAA17326.1 L308_C1_175 [Mycobacterium leprae]